MANGKPMSTSITIKVRPAAEAHELHEKHASAVEQYTDELARIPIEIDAATEMELTLRVACTPPRELRGVMVQFLDGDGKRVGQAELGEFDGDAYPGELVLKAPQHAGVHTWTAVLPAHSGDQTEYEAETTQFSFRVKKHTATVLVWDVPPAVVAGEAFTFKVGVKCSAGCRLENWRYVVKDQTGIALTSGVLGSEPWNGTAAIYYAEVAARAPVETGLHQWTIGAPSTDAAGLPHQDGAAHLSVRSVSKPDYVVAVEAVDRATQTPIKGANVAMHPYRATTGADGVAHIHVSKGQYRVLISGPRHMPHQVDTEVTADTLIRAELDLDEAPADYSFWL
jgi:hypothetical protein